MSDVSVIIPSHNTVQFIGDAIESVLDQTDPPSQVVVVDDSTDGSPQVIERYCRQVPSKIELIRVEPCNVSQARNVGLERATGRFVALLDGDDIWLSQKTEKQIALLEQDPAAVGAICGLFRFKLDLADLGRPTWNVVKDRPAIVEIIRTQMAVASATLFRRDAMGPLRFDPQTGHAEDTIFAAELGFAGHWRCLTEPLLGRRVHDSQVTSNPWHAVWNTQTRVEWCRRHAERIGPDEAAQLQDDLWRSLVELIERRFWKRETSELRSLIRKVNELCPHVWAQSSIAGRRIYPRWVYGIRDWVSKNKE